MLYTENLEKTILLEPARLDGASCNSLKIISAFTDCGRIMSHLIELKDGALNEVYNKSIHIDLILGMTRGSSLTKTKHQKIRDVIRRINGIREMPRISCKYVYFGQEVHSKVYIWENNGIPKVAFCGSANYTNNAFQKRRECMAECDEVAALDYYKSLLAFCVDCFAPDVEEKINFAVGESQRVNDEIDNDNLENLNYADYIGRQPIDTLKLSLLTAKGDVGYGSGINWGIRKNGTKRDRDQAYIPYNRGDKKPGFFPDRINPEDKNCPLFKVVTKDAGAFYMRMAQDNNKAIQSAESNAILGKWIRDKLGVASGTFVTKEMLQNYGNTDVLFKKYSNGVYTLDFEPEEKSIVCDRV